MNKVYPFSFARQVVMDGLDSGFIPQQPAIHPKIMVRIKRVPTIYLVEAIVNGQQRTLFRNPNRLIATR